MDFGLAFAMMSASCTEDSYSKTGEKGICSDSTFTVELAQGSVTRFKDVTVNRFFQQFWKSNTFAALLSFSG